MIENMLNESVEVLTPITHKSAYGELVTRGFEARYTKARIDLKKISEITGDNVVPIQYSHKIYTESSIKKEELIKSEAGTFRINETQEYSNPMTGQKYYKHFVERIA